MSNAKILRTYLHPPILQTAQAGKLRFLNRLHALLTDRGWKVQILPSGTKARDNAPRLPGYALFNMEKPTHERALTFRLAYHYPFWRLERQAERWRWPVARAVYEPGDPTVAKDFANRLQERVLPGPAPVQGDYALVPLQGKIRDCRSFQTFSPIEMVRLVAKTGRSAVVTLHPKEIYDDRDMALLHELAARYPNLTIGGNTSKLLRDCAFVATQNSAVAFDGYILGKPAVLFAQTDFHHIGLNVAELGAATALDRAADHRPDFAGYLDWFLRQTSIDMMAPDADERLLSAMARGGWPV